MKLTSQLPPAGRERVEGRLRSNLIVWLTTVRPDGQLVTVPVWFPLRPTPGPDFGPGRCRPVSAW